MNKPFRVLLSTWGVLLTLLFVMMGCSSSSATLTSIDLSPSAASIAAGAQQQFTATGRYSDDTTKDVTAAVAWTSSDEKVATISSSGLAKGVAAGTVTISASLDDGSGKTIVGKTTAKVSTELTLVSLAVTPPNPSLAVGTMRQFTATGTYSDDTTKDVTSSAKWSTSDDKVATISAAGVVTAVGAGSVTITAKLNDKSGTATVTVTTATLVAMEITSTDPFVAKGLQEQFGATGIFDDNSKQILTAFATWASSDPSVTISDEGASKGLATAVSEGSTVISASFMGVSGSVNFQVTAATLSAIAVTPFTPVIAKGTGIAFSATGILSDNSYKDLTPFVAWTSSDESVATVSNTAFSVGLATGVAAGTTKIKASYRQIAGDTTLTVTAATMDKVDIVPLNPVLAKGTTARFSAIATFSDGTAQDLTMLTTWASSDPTVAAISNVDWFHGEATALKEGTTNITASLAGKSASTSLSVTPATLTGIAVTPSFPTIAKGTALPFVATGIYSDKTTQNLNLQVTWKSSDTTIASISNAFMTAGYALGLAEGKTTITASLEGVSGATTLTVSQATLSSIVVTPASPSIAKGTSVQLYATGIYSDNSSQDLTHWVVWSSSDASVVVSNAWLNHGQATGQVEGSATVTATFYGGVSGSTKVTVSTATLSSIAITPQTATIAKGTNVLLSVIGTYSDNSTQDLTEVATWQSSSEAVSVSDPLVAGLASGVDVGEATITAKYGGKTATATVTVSAAALASVAITPANPTIAKGTTVWFTTTATYTDGTHLDVTGVSTWTTTSEAIALVSNAWGSRGLATSVSTGQVTITASFGGKSATTTLTVTPATLTTITVTPADSTVAKGSTKQFTAVGTFTDSTTQDLTTQVTWTSSDGTKAIISNVQGSRGLASGVSPGTVTISAYKAGKVGSTSLTVN